MTLRCCHDNSGYVRNRDNNLGTLKRLKGFLWTLKCHDDILGALKSQDDILGFLKCHNIFGTPSYREDILGSLKCHLDLLGGFSFKTIPTAQRFPRAGLSRPRLRLPRTGQWRPRPWPLPRPRPLTLLPEIASTKEGNCFMGDSATLNMTQCRQKKSTAATQALHTCGIWTKKTEGKTKGHQNQASVTL